MITGFLAYKYVNAIMYHCSLPGSISLVAFEMTVYNSFQAQLLHCFDFNCIRQYEDNIEPV